MGERIICVIALTAVLIFSLVPQIFAGESFITLKYVEKHSFEDYVIGLVEFLVSNNSGSAFEIQKDSIFLVNKDGVKYPTFSEPSIANCEMNLFLVLPNIPQELTFCFKVSKDITEDYFMLIENTTITQSEIPIYLNSHDVPEPKNVIYDLRKVFLTIRDVEYFTSSIGRIVAVETGVYNGHTSVNEIGEVTIMKLPVTGSNFFVFGQSLRPGEAVWEKQFTAQEHKECPENHSIGNEYAEIRLCFNLPTNAKGSYDDDLWLVLNDSSGVFFSSGGTQEKRFHLTPFLLEDETKQIIPEWVRNIFLWYGQGQIGEDELISALQFLVKEGIIKV